jgi:hypothetical protein
MEGCTHETVELVEDRHHVHGLGVRVVYLYLIRLTQIEGLGIVDPNISSAILGGFLARVGGDESVEQWTYRHSIRSSYEVYAGSPAHLRTYPHEGIGHSPRKDSPFLELLT